MWKRACSLVVCVLAATWSERAGGTVSQVDGTIVPTDDDVQQVLDCHEPADPSDPNHLDARRDAYTFPQIFLPPPPGSGQVVTFVDLREQAGFENTFGWYNVSDPTVLHKIFECSDEEGDWANCGLGTVRTVDFDAEYANGNWDGGFIGFYLITPEDNPSPVNCGDFDPPEYFGHIYYTQTELNGDGDYVHFLVYSSKTHGDRFYFAFEDLFRGGDNDFSDMVIRVDGLTPPCVPEPEVCNGLDDDCDGQTDEDTTDSGGPCGSDVGECQPGTYVCVNGSLVCQGGVGPKPEVCDGLDNDCDGVTDDNPIDAGSVCGSSVGECSTGLTVCQNGSLVCQGAVGPSPEVCDGLDNDCNGLADDNPTDDGQPCGTDEGVCQMGTTVCRNGSLVCQGGVGPSPEVCDGLDNDCDGSTDEDTTDSGGPCGSDVGECRPGAYVCVNGSLVCQGAVGPTTEVCDGKDNDCNGQTDDNPADAGQPCGLSTGECRPGLTVCVAGALSCRGGIGPMPEVCDGRDNDCDGLVDEDDPRLGESCGLTDEGACRLGSLVCIAGSLVCDGAIGPERESCDCVDNDCNGLVDDDAYCPPGTRCVDCTCRIDCSTGEFQCPGGMECQDGYCVPTPCYGVECGEGQVCRDGECVDLCQVVQCDEGEVCVDGRCVEDNCYGLGCPEGQICRNGECVEDPCDGVSCGPLQFCRDGECVDTCEHVVCREDEHCVDGRCEPDPCAGVDCGWGQVCEDGECVEDLCRMVTCGPGRVCRDGQCVDDPCAGVSCPLGGVCSDGQCRDPANYVPGRPGVQVLATGPGGCACSQSGPSGLPWLLLLGMLFWWTVRGRRRSLWVAVFFWLWLPSGCKLAPYAFPDIDGHMIERDAQAKVDAGPCQPTNGGVELCDGIDNDCDGLTDEDFDFSTDPENCGACGTRCERMGAFTACQHGTCVLLSCAPGFYDLNGDESDGCEYACNISAGGEELCDGIDNDCDGLTDEDFDLSTDPENCGGCGAVCRFRNAEATCAMGQCQLVRCHDGFFDLDGDPSNGCEYPCQETNGGVEICDGVDNDCNGQVDDGVDTSWDPENCGACGRVCRAPNAVMDCVAGACDLVGCHDGFADLDGDPSNGCEYPCQETNGGVEICDGVDNDCNGVVDENPADVGGPCGTNVGECQQGVWACSAGVRICSGEVAPRDETCDGLDNDCDGLTDEDTVDTGDVCGTNVGACEVGVTDCQNGSIVCSGGIRPQPEVCDGLDNDCNGVVDDNLTDVGTQCGVTDVGPCEYGTWECHSGSRVCVGSVDPQPEVCDGLDNDCDGSPDPAGCVSVGGLDVLLDTNYTSTSNAIQPDLSAHGDSVYVVYTYNDGGVADVYFTCSLDRGSTWTAPVRLDAGSTDTFKPRVLADPNGNWVYVVYTDFRRGGYRDVYLRRTAGCGQAFDTEIRLDAGNVDSLNVDLAADGAGHVCVVWEEFVEGSGTTPPQHNIALAASSDYGASWSGPFRVNQEPANPQDAYAALPRVAVGQGGRCLVVWEDRRNGASDIYLNYTDDQGASFQTADLRLDTDSPGAASSKHPRIAADGAGHVYVTWQDLRRGSVSDIYFNRSADNGATWLAADRWLDSDKASTSSYEPRIALGSGGRVYVAWQDFREGLPTVRLAASTDYGQSFAGTVRASSQQAAYVSELELAASGTKAFVVFADDRSGLRDIYLNFALEDGAAFQPEDLRLDTDTAGAHESFSPVIVPNGAGGAYVIWTDTRRDGLHGDIYFNKVVE